MSPRALSTCLGCSLPRERSFWKTPSRRSVSVSNIEVGAAATGGGRRPSLASIGGRTMDRPTGDRRTMERQLVTLRWLVAAIGAAQVALAVRAGARDPPWRSPRLGDRDRPGRREPAPVASGSTASATTGWRLASAPSRSPSTRSSIFGARSGWRPTVRTTPVWVLGYLLPLEGAARWGWAGALVGAAAFVAGQLGQELYLRATESAAARLVGGARVPRWDGRRGRRGRRLVRHVPRPRRGAGPRPRPRGRARRRPCRGGRRAGAPGPHGEVALFHATVLAESDAGQLREHAARDRGGDRPRARAATALGLLVRENGPGRRDRLRRDGGGRRPRVPARRAPLPRLEPGRRGGRGAAKPIGDGTDLVAPMLARGEIDRGDRTSARLDPTTADRGPSPPAGPARRPAGPRPRVGSAARRPGGDRQPPPGARPDEVRLRGDHEPRAPHPARGDPRLRRHAPPPRRRALAGGDPRVPRHRDDPDRPLDRARRRPARGRRVEAGKLALEPVDRRDRARS